MTGIPEREIGRLLHLLLKDEQINAYEIPQANNESTFIHVRLAPTGRKGRFPCL